MYELTGLYCILSTCNMDTIKQTWIIKKKGHLKVASQTMEVRQRKRMQQV